MIYDMQGIETNMIWNLSKFVNKCKNGMRDTQ